MPRLGCLYDEHFFFPRQTQQKEESDGGVRFAFAAVVTELCCVRYVFVRKRARGNIENKFPSVKQQVQSKYEVGSVHSVTPTIQSNNSSNRLLFFALLCMLLLKLALFCVLRMF